MKMKTINNFIQEKLKVNSSSKINNNNLFNNVNIEDWKWPNNGISDNELMKCKDNVRKFAYENYDDKKTSIEIFFKDTYKEYLKTNNWTTKKINEQYEYMINLIKKHGWSQVESFSLEQGWWHFANWLIEQH